MIPSDQYNTIGVKVGSVGSTSYQNYIMGMNFHIIDRCNKRMLKINKLYEEVHSKNVTTKVN